MSERKLNPAGILHNQYADGASQIDENDIIDVSMFDFTDSGRWLFVRNRCVSEPTVQDLYTWLKSEPELDLRMTDANSKRSIDTRTFTRPKKRSSRMSFESIIEALAPSTGNPRNAHNLERTLEEDGCKTLNTSGSSSESVPPMLKPTATAHFLSNEGVPSGQESMEAFLNVSQSKGIDSFINLTEPELGDVLMNVSQPSILYSSITSIYKDACTLNATQDLAQHTAIVTGDTSGISKPDKIDVTDVNITFLTTDTGNSSVMERTYCASPTDRTFTNIPEEKTAPEMNSTFCAESVTNLSEIDKKDRVDLAIPNINESSSNLTITDEYLGVDSLVLQDEPIKRPSMANVTITKPSNATFNCDSDLNSTFKMSVPIDNHLSPKRELNSTFKSEPLANPEPCPSSNHNNGLYSKLKAPMSLRRELLAEVQRSGTQPLDTTYNHTDDHDGKFRRNIEETIEAERKFTKNIPDIPVGNKYNTYKKEKEPTKVPIELGIHNSIVPAQRDLQDRKYYTFTKKAGRMGGKTDMENDGPLENMDATFCKPMLKLKKKLYAPRPISRLPQFLQKSNPNLVSSSLKTATVGTGTSNIGYLKGSQPNILQGAEKATTNNVYTLAKLKTGSIQRLLESNINTAEFQMAGAGSTESIESTQSAHSAPDLDDRLSVCSDSSHNSYSTRTMNIEQLHQIVRMQEDSLKQDGTPKATRRILENTWVDYKKDLPSPIHKNGADRSDNKKGSPLSIESDIVASSPIISPVGSSQSLNIESKENVVKTQSENVMVMRQETQMTNKIVENRTRLRQPTNFKGGVSGNRIGLPVASGIPRPPSRIPGPRFQRPIAKTDQGDVKRGYL